MKIVLYARVSTDEQAKHGESISDQLQALRAWAEQNGHRVVGEYKDEGYSAHKAYKSRPALVALLNDIDSFDAVIFTKFDRWTRKASEYYKVQDILDAHGVTWKAILEDYETMTSDGRFKVGIMLSVNQHEAERTSDRLKFTFAQKRERGEICSGNMPRGYVLPKKSNQPVKDAECSEAMQAFFDTYLQGRSLKAAILAAHERGCSFPQSSASFILRNAKNYCGVIQGVPCEPYLTAEQAEIILSTRKKKPRPSGYCYLFSCLLVCADCGHHFGGHLNNKYRKDGSCYTTAFYNCNNRHRRHPHECDNGVAILERDIEQYALDHIGLILDDMVAEARKRVNAPANKENAAQRIVRLEKRKERAINAYIDGLITKERLTAERESIDAEIAAINAPKKEKTPDEIQAILPSGWREMYERLPQEGKREFWFRTVKEIRIDSQRNIEIILRV